MQPRYTFRIDMNNSFDDIYNHFSKTTKQRIQKAKNLETEVEIGTIDDIDTFYNLMMLTENRKDFVSYSKDYYKTQYEIFSKNNMVKLFLGKVNTEKIINNLENANKEIDAKIKEFGTDTSSLSKSSKNKLKELEKSFDKNEKEIEKYKDAQDNS